MAEQTYEPCRAPSSGFTDANGRTVRPPDEVQYEDGTRHGELVEVFSDGDAWVRFFDSSEGVELVKWRRLCGVPEEYRIGPTAGEPTRSTILTGGASHG